MSTSDLRSDVVDALRELGDLELSDPAAGAARRAVRLAQLTLEAWWLPALDRPPSSDPPPVATARRAAS